MLLTQFKGSFKRLKKRLVHSIKGQDGPLDSSQDVSREAPDLCAADPAAVQPTATQVTVKQQLQQPARASCGSNQDQMRAGSPCEQQHSGIYKAQHDCDIYLSVPSPTAMSPVQPWRHAAGSASEEWSAMPHSLQHYSVSCPQTLTSVTEADPVLNDSAEATCYARPGACYASSSGCSSCRGSSPGGSQAALSRGSSWGDVAGSIDGWSTGENAVLQAACEGPLLAGSPVAQPAASHSPAPASSQPQLVPQQQQQQQQAKVLSSPLGGFWKGLLGRTRSAPSGQCMALQLGTDVQPHAAGINGVPVHSAAVEHAQAGSSPGSASASQPPHVLLSACSLPNYATSGAKALRGGHAWSCSNCPLAAHCRHHQSQAQQQQQQEDHGTLFAAQHSRGGTCSSLPAMVPVAPLQPPSPTKLLAVSVQLPRKMARTNWSLADFSVVRRMYKGQASSVFHAIDRHSGMAVALKVYHMERLGQLNHHQVHREVRLHASLLHENIIRLYAAFEEGQQVVMVQEYASGGDLYGVLQRSGGRLSERQAVEVVLQPFLLALHYMHTRGILHRDIKPENVLFTADRILKIADFGLAIDLTEEHAVTRAGTLDYMAPEVLRCPAKERPEDNKSIRRLQYNNSVDAWAVGVFAYELVVGFPPFASNCARDSMQRIMAGPSAVVYPKRMSDGARLFIGEALQMHPGDRPTVKEMLLQPWVTQHSRRRSMRVPDSSMASHMLLHHHHHKGVTGSFPVSPASSRGASMALSCSPAHALRPARQSALVGGVHAIDSAAWTGHLQHKTDASHDAAAAAKGLARCCAGSRGCAAGEPQGRRLVSPLPLAPPGDATCALLRQSAEALQRWEQACRRAGSSDRPPLYPPSAAAAASAGQDAPAAALATGAAVLVSQTCS